MTNKTKQSILFYRYMCQQMIEIVLGSIFKASTYDVDVINSKVLVDILKLNVQNIFLGYWVSNVAPYIMNI